MSECALNGARFMHKLGKTAKFWNYVCKLAPPTSFCSPNAFQLFVRKLMSTHLSRVYDLHVDASPNMLLSLLIYVSFFL